MYVDYDGTEAILITNYNLHSKGLPIVGHSALLIKYGDQWYFTEFGGSKKSNATVELSLMSDLYDEETKKNLLPEALNDPEIFIAKYYDLTVDSNNLVYLDTDYSGYETYKDLETDILGVASSYNHNYNLFNNNCAHYVQDILALGENTNTMATARCLIPGVYSALTRLDSQITNIKTSVNSIMINGTKQVVDTVSSWIGNGINWLRRLF
jgi:hypothetical protein